MSKRVISILLAALMCVMLLFAYGCDCTRDGLVLDEESEFEAGEATESVYDLDLFSSCG